VWDSMPPSSANRLRRPRMRKALAFVGFLASCDSAAAALVPAIGGACGASNECAMDDAVMMQRMMTRNSVALPDFGLGKLLHGVERDVADATAKASGVSPDAITTVGGTINNTLSKLVAMWDEYALSVNRSVDEVRDGVTAIFVEAFHISAVGANISGAGGRRLLATVSSASDAVNAVLLSTKAVERVIQTLPDTVVNMTGAVNATMQEAEARCRDFAAGLADLHGVLQSAAGRNSSRKAPSLSQAMFLQFANMRESIGFVSADVVVSADDRDAKTLEALAASEAMSELHAALRSSRERLAAFAASFVAFFASLEDAVTASSKGRLSDTGAAEVSAVFAEIAGSAQRVAGHASLACGQLFDGIAAGAAGTGVPGAARGRAPGCVLVSALLALGLAADA